MRKMEVKGIGQNIPTRSEGVTQKASKFEEVFDESRKQMVQVEKKPEEQKSPIEIQRSEFSEFESLKSPYIDNNTLFVNLKNWMAGFHKEIQEKMEVEKDSGFHLKVTLYECLTKLLREIVQTTDRNLQMNYLQRVYEWFANRNREKKKGTSLRQTIKLLAPIQETASKNAQKEIVPPIEANNTLLYQQKMRTYYPDLKSPKERLEDYHHRLLSSPKQEESHEDFDDYESERGITTRDSAMFSGGSFSPKRRMRLPTESAERVSAENVPIAARSTYLSYAPRGTIEEQKIERHWFAKKNRDIAQKRNEEELNKEIEMWGKAKGRFNENLVRKYENSTYGSNFVLATKKNQSGNARVKTDLGRYGPRKGSQIDFKKVYEETSDGGDEDEENEFVTNANHSPGQSPIAGKKTLPVIRKTSDSPLKKGPLIIDMRESDPQLEVTSAPIAIVPDVKNAIYEIDKKRVDYIRKIYGAAIGETDDRMSSPVENKNLITLSLYNKKVRRPFNIKRSRSTVSSRRSPATHAGSRAEIRMNQMEEISNIKQSLAKEDIPCTARVLERAILIPEDYPAFRMTVENFLRPGSRLFINPFAKPKKGKKGKKKSKK